MDLDIVFNIDYATEHGVSQLFLDIPKYIEYIDVNDMEQFERLVMRLNEDVICYIWVHPSLNATKVIHGSDSQVITDCIPELEKHKIDFTLITRSTGAASEPGGGHFKVPKMLDLKKTKKSYTVFELKKILSKRAEKAEVQSSRNRLQDSFRSDIKIINARLDQLRGFIVSRNRSAKLYWFENLFELPMDIINTIFNFPYWRFESQNFRKFLNLSQLESPILEEQILNVPEIVKFDSESKRWMIDFSFYDEVSHRFERQNNPDYREKLAIATSLYVVHEAVHKVHNLDCNTVNGIGNFPRIIEEADYQADSIAILTELAFWINMQGGISKTTSRMIIDKLCGIIEIAIETTFSFNPVHEILRLIQVRRVNRYLIWFYHYFKIKEYEMENIESPELLIKLLAQFAIKPMMEITGPTIKSNSEKDRTFYDFDQIRHKEEVAVMKPNNMIIRMGEIQGVQFKNFYEGIRESDFKKMYSFLKVLFDNNRAAMF